MGYAWGMTVAGVVLAGVTALAGQAPPQPDEVAKRLARGKVVYAEQKCAACHLIKGVGNKRSVLDGVGSRLKAAEVRQWIVAPRKMKPTVRKPDYSKLSAADLDALVAYILSLTNK
jgi:cytochrome c oxidase subunit II